MTEVELEQLRAAIERTRDSLTGTTGDETVSVDRGALLRVTAAALHHLVLAQNTMAGMPY